MTATITPIRPARRSPPMFSSDGLDRIANLLLEFALAESASGRFELPPLVDPKQAPATDLESPTT